jgi:tetratricopeptide (TPR) repeat protein
VGRLLPLAAAAALCAGCSWSWPRLTEPDPEVEERIRYYEGRVGQDPELYQAHASLGNALLDRAREMHDPDDLAEARASLLRSVDLQPNAAAFHGLAAVENFAHRFERALDWGCQAAEAMPWNREVTATLVESHLGLGQMAEAELLLERPKGEPPSFPIEAARALVHVAHGRSEEAAAALIRAAVLAHEQGAWKAVRWAEVRAAGVWLDAGRPERAQPFLQAAGRWGPANPSFWVHGAEYLEGIGEWDAAFLVYMLVSNETWDPELAAQASRLARVLGDEDGARMYFENAEGVLRHALDMGEVYPLEGLAGLYEDAGVRPYEARELARRNLQYKRDASAWALARRFGATERY